MSRRTEMAYKARFPGKLAAYLCRVLTGCCPNRDLVTTPPYDEIDELLI